MVAQNMNGGPAAVSSIQTGSRTKSIAFIGLTIAITAVSAWITVPLGPVPFTLQMFAITFAIVVLQPREAIFSILGYLALGALGVPVFSGMRGGIGVLAGPTGGFLWGYIFGVAAAVGFLYLVRTYTDWDIHSKEVRAKMVEAGKTSAASRAIAFVRSAGVEVFAGVLFTGIAYICGMFQYMAVAQVDLGVAFATCCAPFIMVDLAKIVAAVIVAQQVRAVVNR